MNVSFDYYIGRHKSSHEIIRTVFNGLKPIFKPINILSRINYDLNTQKKVFGVEYDGGSAPKLDNEVYILSNYFTRYENEPINITNNYLKYKNNMEIDNYGIWSYGNISIYYPTKEGLKKTWVFREANSWCGIFRLELLMEKIETDWPNQSDSSYPHCINIDFWYTSIFSPESNKFGNQLESSKMNIKLVGNTLKNLFRELDKINKTKGVVDMSLDKSKWTERAFELFKKEIPQVVWTGS